MCHSSDTRIQSYKSQVSALTHKIEGIFSGRAAVFLPYTHRGLYYSESLMQDFIKNVLAGFEKETGKKLSSDQALFYGSFFKFAVLFCELRCNADEWTFESIIKLARTLERNQFGISAADILYRDILEECANDPSAPQVQISSVRQAYSTLYDLYPDNYHHDFPANIDVMIDQFLVSNHISLYSNECDYRYAFSLLHTAMRRIHHIQLQTIGDENEQ